MNFELKTLTQGPITEKFENTYLADDIEKNNNNIDLLLLWGSMDIV